MPLLKKVVNRSNAMAGFEVGEIVEIDEEYVQGDLMYPICIKKRDHFHLGFCNPEHLQDLGEEGEDHVGARDVMGQTQ